MTSRIEETRCTMYKALAALKAGGRWLMKKQNAEAFETALEEHLEEQRQLIERQRLAYRELFNSKLGVSPEQDAANVLKTKAQAMAIMRGDLQPGGQEQARLEAVNRTLVRQVERLLHELDVLTMANEAADEQLRSTRLILIDAKALPPGAELLAEALGRLPGFKLVYGK